jgi:glycosyltransferase involved in cell wall biosynthesis
MTAIVGDQLDSSACVTIAGPPSPSPTNCIKVLHLINGDLYAGAERVQDLLASRMGEFGFELGFACLKSGRFAAVRRSQQTPLFDVRMRSRLDLSIVRRLVYIIRDGGYCLLHTHSPRAAIVGRVSSALAGVPMVHHLHSPADAEYKQFWRNQINGFAERLGWARAAALIAVSHSVADHARRHGLPARRISVVHNGVSPQGPLPERHAPESLWTIGTAALFRPRKGLEVLLEALAILRSQGLPVRLRAVGSFFTSEYEKQIKAQAARLDLENAIDWVGFVHDVIGEMRRMDVFVLPSLFGEGLPMVVLEAMSAGVPVVGTRIEGVPEAVRDGVDGLLAAPGDPGDLARTIARVIRREADWSELRRSAHERQAGQFSDRSMAAGVAKVYSDVLRR